MTVRIHEQKDLIDRVNALFKDYDDFELILNELASLGFLRTGGNPEIVAVENTEMEVYVHINLDANGKVKGFEVLTFDEIKEKLK